MTLRFERDSRRLERERVESAPALVFPLESSVVRLAAGDDEHSLDRARFALVPARIAYRLSAVSPVAPTLTLLIGPAAREAARREYEPDLVDATFTTIVSQVRAFPRTRWVDELAQRYLFEREVCRRHDSAAARFLETELVKEVFFLGREQLQQLTRASALEEPSDLVRRARAWLEQRLFDPVSVAALAKACHASESTLLRAFRRELGVAPSAWVRHRRLDEALLLLESGRYTVSEVAVRVGYAALPAFTVAFHRRFGVAPSRAGQAREGAAVLPPHGAMSRRRKK